MNPSRGLSQRQRDEARQRRRAIARCQLCDPNGWIIGSDGRAHRCTHPGTQIALDTQEAVQLDPTEPRHTPDSRGSDQR